MVFHELSGHIIFAPSITETMKAIFNTKKQNHLRVTNATVCRMLSAPFRMCR
jgi:hypothetical protein